MGAKNNEEELLVRCRRRERRAWCELVGRYDRFVFSVAKGTGLSIDDAADITQVTFSALLEGLDRLHSETRLASWLATVARREARRLLARRNREPTGVSKDAAWSFTERQSGGPDEARRWERLHALLLAMNGVDAQCRDLIVALYCEPDQPSYEDIARQFDMPPGSVGPARARCLERLRDAFTSLEAGDGAGR